MRCAVLRPPLRAISPQFHQIGGAACRKWIFSQISLIPATSFTSKTATVLLPSPAMKPYSMQLVVLSKENTQSALYGTHHLPRNVSRHHQPLKESVSTLRYKNR